MRFSSDSQQITPKHAVRFLKTTMKIKKPSRATAYSTRDLTRALDNRTWAKRARSSLVDDVLGRSGDGYNDSEQARIEG